MPIITGAIMSAVAGFGLVFAFGWGRSSTPPPPVVDTAATESAAMPTEQPSPDRLPPPTEPDMPVSANRWKPRGTASNSEGDASPEGDRYPARPVSHEQVTPAEYRTGDRPLSRFSSPDLPPLEPATNADEPATVSVKPEPESPVADAPAEPAPLPNRGDEPSAIAEPSPEDSTVDEPVTPPVATNPEPAVETPPPDALPPPPAPPAKLAVPEMPPPADPDHGVTGLRTGATDIPATTIPAGMPAPSPFAAAPPVGPPPVVNPSPAASPPSFDRPARLASSSPMPPPPAVPSRGPMLAYDDEGAEPSASPLSPPPDVEGSGVPGPIQLEGVQTPQVAVEKRGPREIQVGKPARYEIIVRNVGTATAHDVNLRDAVPRGTSLIATTPPAAPAEHASDLVWSLGAMPPGGEVRVIMELMPETEGEIGSIASVSFRADATMRSVATKPALAIDCPVPKGVRIGGDLPVTLTLSNPGTGAATGVVLEGYLPDTVSHRSGSELEFDVGQLRPGETRTIDLVLGTRSPGRTPLRLVARSDGGVETKLEVPLEVTAPTLEIAIDMPNRRFLQRPATCTLSMVNSGTAAARSVELAAQLPSGMKFVKANNAGWHDERTNRVLWNLEELPAGETGKVEMVLMPVDAGEQRIMVAARSTDGPSAQVAHACQVEGLAAVSYHVADSEDPVEVGGVTEYVVRVVNEGTKAATGVQLAATLVGDLEPVEASGPGGHRVENLTIIFDPLAKLGAGEEAVYRVRARGLRAGHQRIQVRLVSEDQPNPITKEETTSVYDDR
jgi:uncharacterized repeat protein (TIGR01451 family)